MSKNAYESEMRALASEVRVTSSARLTMPRRLIKQVENAYLDAVSLGARGDFEPLNALRGIARIMETCARRAREDGGAKLPACGKTTRILEIARKARDIVTGETCLSGMVLCAQAYDTYQPLSMAELWALPEAMRIALCEEYVKCARGVIDMAKARRAAEDWVYSSKGDISARRSDAFCERALQLAMELEKPEVRSKVESMLARRDDGIEACVRRAHEMQALRTMRLSHIISVKRALDAGDWSEYFERASRAEAELTGDPSGIYPKMTPESRAAVRARLAALSRNAGAGEAVTARMAVTAARETLAREGARDPRSGVCYYLYTDEGARLLARRLGARGRVPRLRPDPRGARICLAHIIISALLSCALAACCSSWIWIFLTFAPAWELTGFILTQILTRVIKPARLLRLSPEYIGVESATLVVVTALLTSPARAEEMADRLEELGCLINDPHISFMLLGDFRDSNAGTEASDGDIRAAAERRIARLNDIAGREKYSLRLRGREYWARDGLFRARERKRGAIMELCRDMSESGDYKYIITLDADTKILPDAIYALIGTIAHPLNSARAAGGYAILQPTPETDPAELGNELSRLISGGGGMSTYSAPVSNLYQDLCGAGGFCGKGIIDARAFYEALEGQLEDGRILSHDMIEGLIARCGFVSDLAVYDGWPSTFSKYLARAERWTRGDWQLLPEAVSRNRLTPPGRFRLWDNMITSLSAPSVLILFILSAWVSSRGGFSAAVVLSLIMPVSLYFMGDKSAFRRGCLRLTVLPALAFTRLSAASRALWRTFVSKKKLLEWTASGDETGAGREWKTACRVCAILLLPALFMGGWFIPALALMALFACAPGWIKQLEEETGEPEGMTARQMSSLGAAARSAWRFFNDNVSAETGFLPPDNIQIDPYAGAAKRTSPTNIGLYMLSCVAARELGFISGDEMEEKLSQTAGTLARLDKWHGHLYNWYDTGTLKPLSPKYVSAVDSGNLAACLLLCAESSTGELSGKMRDMARDMDFTRLYYASRRLFYIGADAERGRMSESHYDLLASEARILSFTAIMLGQIPVENWRRLGRASSEGVLLSWSGTMFEYLMPRLFMRSAPGTLLNDAMAGAVDKQIAWARALVRPWGISESGYCAFDMQLNYQYRAFGLRQLALGGPVPQEVVAPYASFIALAARPAEATANIERMINLGWSGKYGLYEAIDMTGGDARVVKSWMAHHMGMSLCAACNALTDDSLAKRFMSMPEARAISVLLNEKPAPRIRVSRPARELSTHNIHEEPRRVRIGKAKQRLCDSTLIGAGDASAIVTARGDIIYQRRGLFAARCYADFLTRRERIITTLADESGRADALGSEESRFLCEAGSAKFTRRLGDIEAVMEIAVSPEDGALVKSVSLRNLGAKARSVTLTDEFEAALMTGSEMRAHPAFHQLFLRAEISGDMQKIVRAPRLREGKTHIASHIARTTGRREYSFEDGVSRASAAFAIAPGDTAYADFVIALDAENAGRYCAIGVAGRAINLSRTRAQAAARYAGLAHENRQLAERMCALLADPSLAARAGRGVSPECALVPADIPLVCVKLETREAIGVLRDAVRAHEYCRDMGFAFQVAVIDDCPDGYAKPAREAVNDMIESCYLRDLRFAPGGISVFDADSITPAQKTAILRRAALIFDGNSGAWAQLRRALLALECPPSAEYRHMRGEGFDFKPKNGYGELTENGYKILVTKDNITPAPWVNILASDACGAVISARGGGFIWHGNSRTRRVTRFDNDIKSEGWGAMLYIADEKRGSFARALPGESPEIEYIAEHSLSETTFRARPDGLETETAIFACDEGIWFSLALTNTGAQPRLLLATMFVDWLMGESASDRAQTRMWFSGGVCMAAGAMHGIGFLCCDAPSAPCAPRPVFLGRGGVSAPDGLFDSRGGGGSALRARVALAPGETRAICFLIGCAGDEEGALAAARRAEEPGAGALARMRARGEWEARAGKTRISTGDCEIDALFNRFLPKQTLDARIRARTGLYQPGGAFGFRDQLQDLLALINIEPERVRAHIILCAERQFQSGDVMHWWHPPASGVRTRISDDMLFLPYVCAEYARVTGDYGVLSESAEFLKDVSIPEGAEDRYGETEGSGETASVKEHCLRAFRRAWRRGGHGLALMGAGDWNDGMSRVGARGRGESVWLTMFISKCARDFAEMPLDGGEKAYLINIADEAGKAVSESGWDGDRYLRAYFDDGEKLGARGNAACAIDIITQAWSVISGMDRARARLAMDVAWDALVDEKSGIIKLLAPPFDGESVPDPGYIAAYPPGIRENGGQYTHAACWYLIALSELGDAERAKRALEMLNPFSHARTRERADIYRVEPYVLAADIYSEPPLTGRGGWTWYTGSAAWFTRAVLALAGFERRGARVKVAALRGVWERFSIRVTFGGSVYELISDAKTQKTALDGAVTGSDYIEMTDDGRAHTAVFPQRPAISRNS